MRTFGRTTPCATGGRGGAGTPGCRWPARQRGCTSRCARIALSSGGRTAQDGRRGAPAGHAGQRCGRRRCRARRRTRRRIDRRPVGRRRRRRHPRRRVHRRPHRRRSVQLKRPSEEALKRVPPHDRRNELQQKHVQVDKPVGTKDGSVEDRRALHGAAVAHPRAATHLREEGQGERDGLTERHGVGGGDLPVPAERPCGGDGRRREGGRGPGTAAAPAPGRRWRVQPQQVVGKEREQPVQRQVHRHTVAGHPVRGDGRRREGGRGPIGTAAAPAPGRRWRVQPQQVVGKEREQPVQRQVHRHTVAGHPVPPVVVAWRRRRVAGEAPVELRPHDRNRRAARRVQVDGRRRRVAVVPRRVGGKARGEQVGQVGHLQLHGKGGHPRVRVVRHVRADAAGDAVHGLEFGEEGDEGAEERRAPVHDLRRHLHVREDVAQVIHDAPNDVPAPLRLVNHVDAPVPKVDRVEVVIAGGAVGPTAPSGRVHGVGLVRTRCAPRRRRRRARCRAARGRRRGRLGRPQHGQ
eukprot:OSX69319.1 hypothetical protein BU14_1622s0003 [Porphyra umbilicalis]